MVFVRMLVVVPVEMSVVVADGVVTVAEAVSVGVVFVLVASARAVGSAAL